ncbi:cysteine hydrolase family protein [Rhodomicrobium lacus]|uniref:cysteine hydrolase family protein n=1 Tax=Rhodomicrobium lacus TaxID=2498452 RepID=UPI0026E35F9E|nr:cysteine hydrolase family protein [Rhodomicrobium lacus]WKW51240.1 cysteine hydrolase family protein [Rhodomicrobium lacus]
MPSPATHAPLTLFDLSGLRPTPPRLSGAVVILIDAQNVYRTGPLRLAGIDEAVERAGVLLAEARRAGAKIVHIAHRGPAGSPFDREAESGAFMPDLAPLPGEAVVEKTLANGFHGTNLAEHVGSAGAKIVIAGFMTHNCVSSTVRAAFDHGHEITVAADACATRDLPLGGQIVPAKVLHEAELAGLGDRQACIATVGEIIAAQ